MNLKSLEQLATEGIYHLRRGGGGIAIARVRYDEILKHPGYPIAEGEPADFIRMMGLLQQKVTRKYIFENHGKNYSLRVAFNAGRVNEKDIALFDTYGINSFPRNTQLAIDLSFLGFNGEESNLTLSMPVEFFRDARFYQNIPGKDFRVKTLTLHAYHGVLTIDRFEVPAYLRSVKVVSDS